MYAILFLSEEGPNPEMAWLVWVIFAFFFVMVLIGWWASNQKKSQPEVRHEAPVHHAEHHAQPVAEKSADDLTELEGIGPKVAKVLNAAGIHSFADLAGASPAEVQKSLNAAGMQMMNPEGWIEQAKLAAKGDAAGLEKLQSELKGGRRK